MEEDEIEGQDVDIVNSSPPITVNSSTSSSNVEDVDINDAWVRQRSRSHDDDDDDFLREKYLKK